MKRLYTLFLVIAIAACADEDSDSSGTSFSLVVAGMKCDTHASQLHWLRDYIETTASQGELRGPMYAINDDALGTIIVHQPYIMSCAGCVQFDCAGNRRDPYTLNLWSRMNEKTLIYSPD